MKEKRKSAVIIAMLMTACLLVLAATPAATAASSYTWTKQKTGVSKTLQGISALDASHVWAVGQSGTILFYDGQSWSSKTAGSVTFNAVYALDSTHIWAAGSSRSVYFSSDGINWSKQYSGGGSYAFNGIKAFAANDVWACGQHGIIYHFDGNNWTAASNSEKLTTKQLHSISGVSGTDVWAFGDSGTIIHSDGSVWSKDQQSGRVTSKSLRSAAFIDASKGIAVGGNGSYGSIVALKYDGTLASGKRWLVDSKPASLAKYTLYGVTATDANHAWAVGGGLGDYSIVLFFNGTSWSDVSTTGSFSYKAVTAAGNNVWVAGNSGSVFFNGPSVSSLSPVSGSCGDQVTITGTTFGAAQGSSRVEFNGVNAACSSWSNTKIVAAVPDGATTGLVKVITTEDTTTGGVSNGITFTVNNPNPVPSIISISPDGATEGGSAFTLTVNGTGFCTGSVVKWNGADRATTLVSDHLEAAIPESDIANAGTANVTVDNPSPGGGASNMCIFNIKSSPCLKLSDFDGGLGAEWILNSEGTGEDDSNHIRGTKSIKLTSVDYQRSIIDKSVNLDATGKDIVCVTAYFDNPDNVEDFCFYLGNDDLSSCYWLDCRTYCLDPGWNTFAVYKSQLDIEGSPDWSDITKIRMRVRSKTGTTLNVTFNGLDLCANSLSKGAVIVTFDDGCISQYEQAKPILDAKGWHGVAFICGSFIDNPQWNPGFMSLAQLREFEAGGWDIANHTYNHENLTELTTAEIDATVETQKNWLSANGFHPVDFFAYPYGAYDQTVMDEVSKYYTYARTTISSPYYIAETSPILAPLKMRIGNVRNTTALDTVKNWVSDAANNKTLVVLMFHNLVETPSESTDWTIADFQSLADYMSTINVDVVSFTEYLNKTR